MAGTFVKERAVKSHVSNSRKATGRKSESRDLFNVTPGQTSGCLIYELGNGQWNIPALHNLLEVVLGGEEHVENFRVEHEFENIGHRIMLLNARRIEGEDPRPHLILLAITDVSGSALFEGPLVAQFEG